MLDIFREIVDKSSGEYPFKTVAKRLIVNKDGRVTGVEAEARKKKNATEPVASNLVEHPVQTEALIKGRILFRVRLCLVF